MWGFAEIPLALILLFVALLLFGAMELGLRPSLAASPA